MFTIMVLSTNNVTSDLILQVKFFTTFFVKKCYVNLKLRLTFFLKIAVLNLFQSSGINSSLKANNQFLIILGHIIKLDCTDRLPPSRDFMGEYHFFLIKSSLLVIISHTSIKLVTYMLFYLLLNLNNGVF